MHVINKIVFKGDICPSMAKSKYYKGNFIVDGDVYIESDEGKLMTIKLPKYWFIQENILYACS